MVAVVRHKIGMVGGGQISKGLRAMLLRMGRIHSSGLQGRDLGMETS